MLADILDASRDELVDELERRASFTETTELPIAGRRTRLKALLQEVIGALRAGGISDTARPLPALPASADPALEFRERELVQHYLIDQIKAERLAATCDETVVVGMWAHQAELTRLRDHNERLSTLLDSAHEAAVILAPDGRILYCNLLASQRLHDVVGVSHGEIIGKTPAELGIPSELVIGRPMCEIERLACGNQSFEMTAWGRAKEGTFDAVYRPDGSLGAIALLVRDVHDRKLAETRLAMLTKLSTLVGTSDFEDLAESLARVPIPQFADWCAVSFVDNKRMQRTFVAHRNPADAPLRNAIMRAMPRWDRHPLWQEMLPGGFQLLAEVTDDLLRRLVVSPAQYRLLSQLRVRSVMVVPLVLRGQIAGIVTCAYTQESGRRYGRDDPALAEEFALHAAQAFENARLMKDLKSSEARFRVALAGARTSVYEQDMSLRYVWYYSPLVPHDVIGKTHEESFPADEAAQLTKLKRRVLDEGDTVQVEMDRTLGGEEHRHFRETMAPLRDHTGRIVGVIGASTDITEQQRTQQQLTEAIGFRERMIGILGHDLRNPIGTITLASDLLLHRNDVPPAAREHMLRIRRSADRMKEMIDTLLDFTRLRFLGEVPIAPVPADLADISRTTVDEMRVAWPDRPIDLEVHGDSHGEWDPARMSQTISNLVSNAIAHGERGSAVRVSVEGEGRDVELKVHNDGEPIPEDLMPVLFQPFRRGELHDRSPHGLGLGLYIVEQIVHAHDGSIGVESTPEAGTTFTVHLPRVPAPPASHISPQP
jgi:phosphoserine phosphatase RsbU/P